MPIGGPELRRLYLVNALATPRQKQLAAVFAGIALLAFLGAAPFARVHLAQLPSFITSYQAALFFIDLITALLLFEQFVRLRSMAILILASAYLFDAFIIVSHTLTFPGAFTATGLLGAKMQTTAWLYVFWHGGFSLFVISYTLMRRWEVKNAVRPLSQPVPAIALAILAVVALVIALTLFATVGHDLLPVVMDGGNYLQLVTKGVSPAVWILTLIALILLWQYPQRVVDLWLMLVMWIWLFDIGLSAVIGSSRFDLGFYAGRLFGLIAASLLLVTLIVQMMKLYASALGAHADVEKRFANLARARRPSHAPSLAGRRSETTFAAHENIARYRELLVTGHLDDSRRQMIERLLSEEEAKLSPEERAEGNGG